jgi:hypothetical protein
MRFDRTILVLTTLVTCLACRTNGKAAFVQLAEARQLAAQLRIDFAKASDESNRAVMAETDEESIAFARAADTSTRAVNTAMTELSKRLADLGDPGNAELIQRVRERFERYQAVDKEILKLAVENTNLKARRLLFGPVAEAANAFCRTLQAFVSAAPDSTARRIADSAYRAQLAVREIEVLEAPHIAEAKNPEMDHLEQEMASRQTIAREALSLIEKNARPLPDVRSALDAAKAALDNFDTLSRQLIELSRRNTNVRSLELAMRQKPPLTAACDESLAALQTALANQGFTGTR